MKPDPKKTSLRRQVLTFAVLLAALPLSILLIKWLGNLSVEYSFGGWYVGFAKFIVIPAILFLAYSVRRSGTSLFYSIVDTLSRKYRQSKLEDSGTKQVWGVITEIRKADYTVNDKRPIYLCYRVGDTALETKLTNYALQEAVGRRIPVYIHPDGTFYADQEGVELTPPSETEIKDGRESAGEPLRVTVGDQTVEIKRESRAKDNAAKEEEVRAGTQTVLSEEETEPSPKIPIPGLKQQNAAGPKRPEERVQVPWSLLIIGLIFAAAGLLILFGLIFLDAGGGTPLFGLIFFIPGALISYFGFRNLRRQRDVYLHGRSLEAEITEVLSGDFDQDGLKVYTVRCRAGEQLFETKTVSPPADAVGRTITVMVSTRNPKDYELLLDTIR